MAINLTTKAVSLVDEKFRQKSLSKAFTNSSYDWMDAETIKIYGRVLSSLNNYKATGSNRYGTPEELGNEVQTETLTQDKSTTFTIDKKSKQDTNGTIFEAGKNLKDHVDLLITPAIDTYVFAKMVTASVANNNYAVAAITKQNAYEKFLDGQVKLGNNLVPTEGLLSACSYNFYKYIKLDSSFMLASEIAMGKKINGMVGEVDGVKLVKVPSAKLGSNVEFMIAHPMATVFAQKLNDYKIHMDPPGINGALVEGRVRYDAFVLNNKANAIYTHLNASSV